MGGTFQSMLLRGGVYLNKYVLMNTEQGYVIRVEWWWHLYERIFKAVFLFGAQSFSNVICSICDCNTPPENIEYILFLLRAAYFFSFRLNWG